MAARARSLPLLLLLLGSALLGGRSRAATITAFAPLAGPPGTDVVIAGSGLQTATVVYFGGTDAPGEILAKDTTGVRARVPPNALTGQISVFTSGSGAASSSQIFVAMPRVESFTPTSGGPGSTITIQGANFGATLAGGRGSVTSVWFNGQAARFQVVGINQILAVVPTNALSGPLALANDAGRYTTPDRFEVPAVITGYSPAAARPGDTLELRGRNLDSTLKVEIGALTAPFQATSPTNLTVWIPTNAVNGRLQITTTAGLASAATNVVVLPRVITFTPAFGVAGTNVTLEGGGFHGLTSVQFNGITASYAYVSSTRITTVVPNGTGTGPIKVTTTNGTFTTSEVFTFPGKITSLNPPSGRRGDKIEVTGTDLGGATRVTLNGVDTEFTVVSPTKVTFLIPPLATTGRVTVETPAGPAASTTTITVRALLDSFTPANGGIGTAVRLAGAGLTNLVWVRLGGLDTAFSVINSTNVRAVVPANAFSGTFRVRTLEGQEVESAATFFVDGAHPTVTSFSPTNGLPGTQVTVKGQGFRTASRVQFNGADAEFTVKSSTEIAVTAPSDATTGPIAVTTLDGVAYTTASFEVGGSVVSLRIDLGPGLVNLRWPKSASGFALESTLKAGPEAAWVTVAQAPVTDGTDWRVSVALPPTGTRYFRLRR